MEEAEALFRRLKIYTLLDLALIVPSDYHDTTLSATLDVGEVHTLRAKVERSASHRGQLRVTFWLIDFHQHLVGIFFRTTPYHHRHFAQGSEHTIHGTLKRYRGDLQISQPKSIRNTHRITPKYKTPLKHSEITALIAYYVRESNLLGEGLRGEEVEALMRIHYPKRLDEVKGSEGFKEELVEVLKFVEAYNHLRKLRNKREDAPALRRLEGRVEGFIEALPFALTSDQSCVIGEIQADLKREERASKRMVVGDVGSGKTMVILASAMMALPHKSILMAPTSLLAMQLFEEATKYLPSFVRVALVMQSRDEGDYRLADFIIGTHALLHREDLPQASLIMIDEQHRFGTTQRQMLDSMMKERERKPHFIQFSATPIPRTQAMMHSELVDVSLITSSPFKRTVATHIIAREDFGQLIGHIESQIAQGHQVAIIYPLVEESSEIPYQSIEEGRGFWENRFESVYVTHGKDKQKEEALLAFRERGEILLATTVVEVGISLPRLSIIVVVGAERLGLATLHQLRGRVGRNGLDAWCYLYSNSPKSLRLEKFARCESGFEIAKLDLAFRNSGDILDGTLQSGQKFKWLDMSSDEAVIAKAKERLRSTRSRPQA
jgi:ATP-dependent DNA helicase RecG